MKSIPNRTFPTDPKPTTTADMLKNALNFMPAQGFDITTMRARCRVMDVVDKATEGGMMEFEDSDFQTAVQAVREVKWVQMNKHLISFSEQFGL